MTALALALTLTAGAHKPRVAVLDVQDVSGDQAAHARLLTQIVAGELSRDGALEVMTSNQIREMLGFERQKQLAGCSESSCLAELGGALGVEFLLSGQLGKIGSRYRLDLTLINQVKGRTAAARGDFLPAQEDALADAAVRMVNEVLLQAGLRQPAAALVTPTVGAGPSRTSAWMAYGVAGVLLAGAGVMTAVTRSTYLSARDDYSRPQPAGYQSPSGTRLGWMSPVTDGLWAGALVAAGAGTYLYFSAAPAGSGGELAVGGRF